MLEVGGLCWRVCPARKTLVVCSDERSFSVTFWVHILISTLVHLSFFRNKALYFQEKNMIIFKTSKTRPISQTYSLRQLKQFREHLWPWHRGRYSSKSQKLIFFIYLLDPFFFKTLITSKTKSELFSVLICFTVFERFLWGIIKCL